MFQLLNIFTSQIILSQLDMVIGFAKKEKKKYEWSNHSVSISLQTITIVRIL